MGDFAEFIGELIGVAIVTAVESLWRGGAYTAGVVIAARILGVHI